ncbi:MAG: hypothetical protein NZ937_00605 [Armatimonadetes bacterium]|nr:hypothetical protein [Armatimonadota bacterium]
MIKVVISLIRSSGTATKLLSKVSVSSDEGDNFPSPMGTNQ